jgi:8-oxo-dGTP pyrophosphatase MutT (NUDIX family)
MPHIHEKVDFTVEVFIVHGNKVLLRMHDKYKIWLSVGGHIELDEDPTQAAVREVKEEVGLDITLVGTTTHSGEDPHDTFQYRDLLPPRYLSRHRVSPTHEHVTFVYFAKSESEQVTVTYDDDQSEEWKWFTKADLEATDLRPNIRFYALQALEELSPKV